MPSPYVVWRKKFIARHNCAEHEFVDAVIAHGVGYIFSVFLLCGFIILSTHIFRHLDESIAAEPYYEALLFSYTTITTIGYGVVVPTNTASRAFCIFYCAIGIPMAFLTLSYVGDLFAEMFWACAGAMRYKNQMSEFESEGRLPLKVVWTVIILHSLVGGLIFHYWIDNMPLVSAVYFSFISIMTIGFGDLNPTPDNGCHTIVLIVYFSVGIAIMSTLFGALSGHIRQYSKNLYAEESESRKMAAGESCEACSVKPKTSDNKCLNVCSVNNYLCYKL